MNLIRVFREGKRFSTINLSFNPLFFFALLYIVTCTRLFGLDPQKNFSQYVHTQWTVNDGLPQDTIKAIYQTKDGFIWLGTEEGIVRFDGFNFKVYNTDNISQFKSNNIIVLKEDSSGNLWIGTYSGGLVKFRNGQFTVYTTRDGLPGDLVVSLCEDSEERLWIGTDKGLAYYKEDKIISFSERNGLSNTIISSLYEDSQKRLWIGTFHTGIMYFKDGRFFPVSLNNAQRDNITVRAVIEDQKGNIWVGTESNGLYRLNGKNISNYTTVNGLSNNAVFSLLEDKNGTLWIGTNRGLNQFKDGKLIAFPRDENFSCCVIRALYEDQEGNIWVGMRGKGLWRITDGKFTTFTVEDGLSNNFIRAVYEDESGNLWIGTNSGLDLFKDGKFSSFASRFISETPVFSIAGDKNNSLWVATVGKYGLFRFSNGGCTIYSKKDGLLADTLTALYIDSKDNLWIGTFGEGVYLFKDNQFFHYSTEDGLYSNIIYYIFEDHKGNLWVSTGIGLNCIKDEKIINYPLEELLSDEAVLFMHEDEEKNIWLATASSGLKRIKSNRVYSYSTDDGLYSNKIYSILEDDKGNLWMGCGKGIFCVSKQDLNKFDSREINKIPCKAYNEADGMKTRECYGTSNQVAWKTRDGKLWFATLRGLTMIDPDNIKINTHPPNVFIEKIEVNGESYSPKNESKFGPGVKNINFSFKALSLTAPDGVKFKYKLEGKDKDWIESRNVKDRKAYYKNLLPGNYLFLVKAANKDNIWSHEAVGFEFTVKPYFYQSYTFYGIALFSIFILGMGYTWLRIRNNKVKEMNKYKSSSLSDEKIKDYVNKLFHVMEKEKYFTAQDLDLPKLASSISIPPSHLSQIINIHLKQNFNDFINTYRIKEAKKRLLDPKYNHLKLASIGSDVGFGSKSAFYSAFKKHTGVTPLEFKKRHERFEEESAQVKPKNSPR